MALSKIIVANGGEICKTNRASIAVVGEGDNPGKPFLLPKAIMSVREELKKMHAVVYHDWISKCIMEGQHVDFENYRAPLVSTVISNCICSCCFNY